MDRKLYLTCYCMNLKQGAAGQKRKVGEDYDEPYLSDDSSGDTVSVSSI